MGRAADSGRDVSIVAGIKTGRRAEELGYEYGITRERVYQVLRRELGAGWAARYGMMASGRVTCERAGCELPVSGPLSSFCSKRHSEGQRRRRMSAYKAAVAMGVTDPAVLRGPSNDLFAVAGKLEWVSSDP